MRGRGRSEARAPAIDGELNSRDVGGVVRGQEQGGAGDFVGLANALHWYGLAHMLAAGGDHEAPIRRKSLLERKRPHFEAAFCSAG
jgi:hypothetical protein